MSWPSVNTTTLANRLVLPNGTSYQVLVLPPVRHMRPAVLSRIEELVAAGATIVGPKPLRVPGLEGGAKAEAQLREWADRLWGDCDGQSVTTHRHSQGRVYWGKPMQSVCAELALAPDFSFEVLGDDAFGATQYPGNGMEFIHRRLGDMDLYFLSNQHERPKTVQATFRVDGRLPELWHPDSGWIEIAPEFQGTENGRTKVRLRLDPVGSVFVVFRQPLEGEGGVMAVERNGLPADVRLRREGDRVFVRSREAGEFVLKTTSGGSKTARISAVPAPLELTGPWRVSFPPGSGVPEWIEMPTLFSWTEHEDPELKHFSGTATYRLEVEVPAERLAGDQHLVLDLGQVQVIEEVWINRRSLGILWKAPYAMEVTRALRPGRNRLEIRVANLWVNRLIGDQQYPDDCQWTTNTGSTAQGLGLERIPDWVANDTERPSSQRKTLVAWRWPHLEKKELVPSGLLGPVRLESEVEAAAE